MLSCALNSVRENKETVKLHRSKSDVQNVRECDMTEGQ